jgi:small subunit ribosomal protein S2
LAKPSKKCYNPVTFFAPVSSLGAFAHKLLSRKERSGAEGHADGEVKLRHRIRKEMSTAKDTAASPTQGFEPGTPVTIRTLMDAGAHYGHQTQRWNPKMLPFIYGARNGVHIINLDLTLKKWELARKYIVDRVSLGGNVLFVGTKQQAKDIVREEASRCGGFFVASRWLGGCLSNFQTMKNSIERMRKLENLLTEASQENTKIRITKKERLDISRQVEKLEANLGGIRNMKKTPDVMFVVDIVKEQIAIAEANRLHIPVIALVDTNADPHGIAFPIPSNDDATRTIRLFLSAAADAVNEGRAIYNARFPGGQKSSGEIEKRPELTNGTHVAPAAESGVAVA